MRLTTAAIDRLLKIISQLTAQAVQIDKINAKHKAHKMIENNALFSISLFSTDSDRFFPYVKEVEKKVASLSRLIKADKTDLSLAALDKIDQQIQALVTAINANKTMHDNAQVNLNAKISAIKAHQYKKMAQSVIQSSQSLYQKLTQHHEFERRLLNMLADKEQQLARCKAKQQSDLSSQVLTLHQRLGRCRKAISIIERDIEFVEKR